MVHCLGDIIIYTSYIRGLIIVTGRNGQVGLDTEELGPRVWVFQDQTLGFWSAGPNSENWFSHDMV